MMEWFGDIYGRYYFLVPPLLERWKSLRQAHPTVTLAETFFSAASVEDPNNERHLPALDEDFKQLLHKVWKGNATNDDCAILVPYGILKENRQWSCEYVRRKYFFDLSRSTILSLTSLSTPPIYKRNLILQGQVCWVSAGVNCELILQGQVCGVSAGVNCECLVSRASLGFRCSLQRICNLFRKAEWKCGFFSSKWRKNPSN